MKKILTVLLLMICSSCYTPEMPTNPKREGCSRIVFKCSNRYLDIIEVDGVEYLSNYRGGMIQLSTKK